MEGERLRAEIRAAHQGSDLRRLAELRAAYRSLPIEQRRVLTRAAALSGEAHPDRTFRFVGPVERADPGAPATPGTLSGYFAVFDTWTEVDSIWEGLFMERIARGAFANTIAQDRSRMRVTLNHGGDPELGDRPLGAIADLRERDKGAYYEVSLFDGIPQLVREGLAAGEYGASFRFYVMREQWDDQPKASAYNPAAIPERTINEAQVEEFGPVTYPQYPQASAQLRGKQLPVPARAGGEYMPERAQENKAWLLSKSN